MSKELTPEMREHWPDSVRLAMVERSEQFYSGPTESGAKVYQYGYYDGYTNRFPDPKIEKLNQKIEAMSEYIKALTHFAFYDERCEPPPLSIKKLSELRDKAGL